MREMRTCDVALAVGTRLRDIDSKRRGLELPDKLIHIDWDDRWINRNFKTVIALIGDVPAIFRELAGRLETGESRKKRNAWITEVRQKLDGELEEIRNNSIELEYLEVIREALPRESTLVIDNTQLGYWAEYFYPSYCPRGLIGAKGAVPIGFSFAAAMGVKIAQPKRFVVALIGDGGFLYSSQELATCMRHNINFPVIVNNDNAYGVIAYLQRTAFNAVHESDLENPDFVALARAYGAEGIRVDSPAELRMALKQAFSSKVMCVIELAVRFPEPAFARY